MKLLSLLFLFPLTMLAQEYNFEMNLPAPSPKMFPKNTSGIRIYEYNYSGKTVTDSSLYKHYEYDRKNNTIKYSEKIDETRRFANEIARPSTFTLQFDSLNNITRRISEGRKNYDTGEIFITRTTEYFTYNKQQKQTQDTTIKKELLYTLNGNDTIKSYEHIERKTYVSIYKDTLLLSFKTTKDFTGLYTYENGAIKDSTIYDYPTYRQYEYHYDDKNKLLVEDIFARDDQVMSKTFYYYDHTGRLTEEKTFTGYYGGHKPEFSCAYIYTYGKDGSKTIVWDCKDFKHITKFNRYGNMTGYTRYRDNKIEHDDNNEFVYKKGKITKVFNTDETKTKAVLEYIYNNEGFLISEKITKGENPYILRYFYE